jgi:hypothetical protein
MTYLPSFSGDLSVHISEMLIYAKLHSKLQLEMQAR